MSCRNHHEEGGFTVEHNQASIGEIVKQIVTYSAREKTVDEDGKFTPNTKRRPSHSRNPAMVRRSSQIPETFLFHQTRFENFAVFERTEVAGPGYYTVTPSNRPYCHDCFRYRSSTRSMSLQPPATFSLHSTCVAMTACSTQPVSH